jgi:hypothetical protein
MTEAERQTARSVLINGLSIRQLIAYLEGKSYRDLVDKHMHDIGLMLPATIAVHEDLIAPDERDGAVEILAKVANQASEPSFWSIDAGGFLTSVSCDLNDAVFPKPADEAGVFNLFQLVTAKLADRARVDKDFCRILLSSLSTHPARPAESGTITRMLGIAISDCDAGRISKGQLLSIFQGAINNGDILEEDNQLYVVAHVVPLVDAGLLRSSEHLKAFESRMNQMATDFLAERQACRSKDSKNTR